MQNTADVRHDEVYEIVREAIKKLEFARYRKEAVNRHTIAEDATQKILEVL